MLKKSFVLFLAFMFCVCFATAGAEDSLFAPGCAARVLARKTVCEKYGLTNNTLNYFTEYMKTDDAGSTVIYYAENEDLDYVLGRYTVRIEGDTAEAQWSWDGKDVAYAGFGLASNAWGKDQLTEIWLINRQTSNLSHYALIARALAEEAGYSFGYVSDIPEDNDFTEPAEYDPTKAVLTADDCRQIALKAIAAAYGLPEDRLSEIRFDDEEDAYDVSAAGEPVLVLTGLLWDENGWQEGNGNYTVTVNLATGLVEDLYYIDGIIGNG